MPSALDVFGNETRPSASSAAFTISATCTVSLKPTSGDGSRSKSTKSGRSGLSTREYHVFMSMQPMLTIQSSASSSFTTGASIHFLRRAATRASRPRTRNRRDPLRHVRRRVLLEERLAERAVGIAAHRERPPAQVRHEHVCDLAVVVDQVALRDPLVGPEDLVEVRELDARLGAVRSALAMHLLRAPCPRAAPRRPARAGARRASTRRTRPPRRAPGRTHTTSPFRTFGIFGTAANGASSVTSGSSFAQQLVDRRAR